MLDEIKSLVEFVNKCKVQHLEIFTREDFSSRKSKMGRLFEEFKTKEFGNKEELKAALYGDAALGYGFEKLFTRFQEKLANTLFFIDTRTAWFSERAIAYYNCSRRSYITRILLERGLRKFAISLVEKTLPTTLKYEFTDLSLFFLRTLMRHYSTTSVNFKKFITYKNDYLVQQEIYSKELTLEIMMDNIAYESNEINLKEKIIKEKELSESIRYSTQCLEEDPSIDTIIAASKILLYHFQKNKKYEEYKDTTIDVIGKIKLKPFKSIVTLESLIAAQLTITSINRDYETAELIRKEYFTEINIGNFNWYVINMYYVFTMMHALVFQKAYEIISVTISHKTFDKQPPVIKEAFLVFNAYIQFLIKLKMVEPADGSEFRLNKFLNQVPEYSRDKQGINIPILLIQILFFLVEKKHNRIIDRMESLNLYAYRHLKKDDSFRSQCFIRMLSELVKADFKRKGTVFRTEKILGKMKAVLFETFPGSTEIEIIPYEHLWEVVLNQLE